jgi:hypothetical protein
MRWLRSVRVLAGAVRVGKACGQRRVVRRDLSERLVHMLGQRPGLCAQAQGWQASSAEAAREGRGGVHQVSAFSYAGT